MSLEFIKNHSSSGDKSGKSSIVSTPNASASKPKNTKTLQSSKSGTTTSIKQIEKDNQSVPQTPKELREVKVSREDLESKDQKELIKSQSVREDSFDSKLSFVKSNEEKPAPAAYESTYNKKYSPDSNSDEK